MAPYTCCDRNLQGVRSTELSTLVRYCQHPSRVARTLALIRSDRSTVPRKIPPGPSVPGRHPERILRVHRAFPLSNPKSSRRAGSELHRRIPSQSAYPSLNPAAHLARHTHLDARCHSCREPEPSTLAPMPHRRSRRAPWCRTTRPPGRFR